MAAVPAQSGVARTLDILPGRQDAIGHMLITWKNSQSDMHHN